MERRKFVIGLGALASGAAAATGTGAFSAALIDDRDANIGVSADDEAMIALVPGYDDDLAGSDSTVSSDTVATANNQLAIDVQNGDAGVNVGSTYQIGAIGDGEADVLDDRGPLSSDDVIYGQEDDQFLDDATISDDPAFGIKNNTSNDLLAQLNWQTDTDPPQKDNSNVQAAMVVDGQDSALGDGSESQFVFPLDDVKGETTFGIDSGKVASVSILIVVKDDASLGELSGTLNIRAEGAVKQP